MRGFQIPRGRNLTSALMQPLQPGSGSFVKEDFTMSFFIPFKHQKDAPAPSADDVELTTVKPFCAYVREYGGFSNIEKVETHYKELVHGLNYRGLMTSTPTCFILLHTTLLSSFSTVTMRSG